MTSKRPKPPKPSDLFAKLWEKHQPATTPLPDYGIGTAEHIAETLTRLSTEPQTREEFAAQVRTWLVLERDLLVGWYWHGCPTPKPVKAPAYPHKALLRLLQCNAKIWGRNRAERGSAKRHDGLLCAHSAGMHIGLRCGYHDIARNSLRITQPDQWVPPWVSRWLDDALS